MAVSYKPLMRLLVEKDLKKTDLLKAGISSATLAKLSKNDYISLEIIEKIAVYLDCKIDSIVEFITI